MRFIIKICFICLITGLGGSLLSCAQQTPKEIVPGAENITEYLNLLKGKKVAVVANQASLVKAKHLVDFLIEEKIQIERIFSPEHGFRGTADAGEKIRDGKDPATGIKIVSLYGKHFKPSRAEVKGIDIFVFDLQDVGVRFYTYLSTLHYIMEICAEENIPVIVLDRPNPNAHYIDGPVLEMSCSSFVGKHPVPVVYGMTIGEYAQMINGERWLKNKLQCNLKVVPILNWNRNHLYELPIKPSPNLPNSLSVALYPSLCFFEGTVVSAGRGTDFPFQTYGHPKMLKGDFSYVPRSIEGASKYPKFKGQACNAYDLRNTDLESFRSRQQMDLSFLLNAYQQLHNKTKFFNAFFKNLAGTNLLRTQIEKGLSEEEIRKSWKNELERFRQVRTKYLIYK
jgi:uncharacterized protein YbbC (DUF1343 family)